MSAARLAVFDLETTGIDVESARIVTACLAVLDEAGDAIESRSWLLDPGVEIPEGATKIHGITTAHAVEHGVAAAGGVAHIFEEVQATLAGGLPVCAFNASYDFTLLDREARRHLGHGFEVEPSPIFDPYIVDKKISFRRGKRTLIATADHYGIRKPAGSPHGAEYDAILAGRLMLHLLDMPGQNGWKLSDLSPTRIHDRTIEHARQQRQSLADYYRGAGRIADADAVRPEWPIYPRTESSAK